MLISNSLKCITYIVSGLYRNIYSMAVMHKKIFVLFIGCAAFFCTRTFAQSGRVGQDWTYAIESSVDLENGRKSSGNEESYFLLQLKPGEKQAAIRAKQLEVIRKGKNGYYLVKASSGSISANAHLIENAWQVNNRWKLSPNLLKGKPDFKEVYTIKSRNVQETLHAVSGLPELEVLSIGEDRIRLACSYEQLVNTIISLQEVVYAGKEALNPTTESRVKDLNLVANGINRIHHAYPDLNGKGMTLSVQEMGFNSQDIDLLGREVPSSLRSPNTSGHATEMATIAAGAGNSSVSGKGVAWGAAITSSDFQDVLPDADTSYRELDAWVQNHSYGTEIENFYGALAEAFDKSALASPNLLHIISSGNQGMDAGTGPYEGVPAYANLTGNFKMAKNILTIGAVDTVGKTMDFSSRGPAYDGRVKPELCAYSTAGSSNSTALLSGLAILLQQAYKEQQRSLPASALVKAVLINSARDAGPKGLDFQTGYGNVNGFKALQTLKAGRYFSGSISQGEVKTISLEVPANVQGLKVSLVWTDPAAKPNAAVALVNDIDMQLKDGNGTSWLPWVLDSNPDAASLSKAAVRAADHLNNIEQITVENPAAETYTISLSGYDIPEGPQDFYIAYQWEEAERFSWAYPTGSDFMPYNGESAGYFRWESSLVAASGRLEYSMDGGESWQLIKEAVDLRSGAFRWEAPQESGLAQARMTVGNVVFLSDRFALSRPLKASLGFSCGDSILIQWNKLDKAQSYELFTLGSTRLEPVAITADTLMVLKKDDFPNGHFAVRALLEGAVPTIRSVTFDYALQGSYCYLSSFYSELTPEQEMFLNLQLGTTYQVEEIAMERKEGDEWVLIANAPLEGISSFRIADKAPLQGLNVYRARLRLANGQELISEEDRNYYLSQPPFVVFPNPVSSSDGLRIFSKNMEVQVVDFKLYTSLGQVVAQSTLKSDRAFIPLKNVKPGFYFYSIELEGRQFQGRLVVE